MLPSSVTLFYGGRCFSFTEDAEKVLKGKLACDCTKSQLIREYCDHAFPTLRCGNEIVVVSLLPAEDRAAQGKLVARTNVGA